MKLLGQVAHSWCGRPRTQVHGVQLANLAYQRREAELMAAPRYVERVAASLLGLAIAGVRPCFGQDEPEADIPVVSSADA